MFAQLKTPCSTLETEVKGSIEEGKSVVIATCPRNEHGHTDSYYVELCEIIDLTSEYRRHHAVRQPSHSLVAFHSQRTPTCPSR